MIRITVRKIFMDRAIDEGGYFSHFLPSLPESRASFSLSPLSNPAFLASVYICPYMNYTLP